MFVVILFASVALLAVLHFNRREIGRAHDTVAESVNDPSKFNLGLIIEPVGAPGKAAKRLVFSKL